MKIANETFVEIDYILTLDSGEEVDRSAPQRPLGFVFGANQIVPGLENQLDGMDVGDKAKLVVEAEDAYGPHHDEMVKDLPRQNFPEGIEIQPGMVFQAQTPHGPTHLRIVSTGDDTVQADFNHPLAGQRLTFDVTVVSVREATAEDMAALSSCGSCCDSSSCDSGSCDGH